MDYLKNTNIKDLWLTSFIEYINTTVAAIRKQLSHISPSLRYVRESKEKIILIDYFKEVEDFYKSRFESNNMELRFKQAEKEKFILFMNKGKLNQVMDNLLLNSEYWLREDMRLRDFQKLNYPRNDILLQEKFAWMNDHGTNRGGQSAAVEHSRRTQGQRAPHVYGTVGTSSG